MLRPAARRRRELSRTKLDAPFAGTVTIDGVSAFAQGVMVAGTTEVWIGISNISYDIAATTVDFDDVVLRMLP